MFKKTPNIVFQMPCQIRQEEGMYVAWNFQLDIHSSGYTVEEAIQHLAEDLALFFKSCHKLGSLQEAMEEAGFDFHDDGRDDEIVIDGVGQPDEAIVKVPVPVHILAGGGERPSKH